MNFGILPSESFESYHTSKAVSATKLKFFDENYPAFYKATYIDKEIPRPEETNAFRFGRYLHSLALEGELVTAKRFVVAPEVNMRTNAGKETWAAFEKDMKAAGKSYIEKDEIPLADKMAESIRNHPQAVALLSKGVAECTFRHNRIKSMPLQCRPDWYNPGGHELTEGRPYVIDLKSIDSLKGDWAHQFHKFGYHLSAALTRSVIEETVDMMAANAGMKEPGWMGPPPMYLFLVVEKSGSNECCLFQPDEISLDLARQKVVATLKEMKKCYDSGEWPGAPRGINQVSLPEWMIRKGSME